MQKKKNMTWFKKEEKIEKIEKIVKCDTCACLLNESDAQKVKVMAGYENYFEYYCRKDKKPYIEVKYPFDSYSSDIPNKIKYYAELRVDEKGEPLGYKKVV